jgi:mRNA interferase YafQ
VYTPVSSKQFKKDYKRISKSGQGTEELDECLRLLIAGTILPPRYEDHPMKGEWKTSRDCHAKPDFVIVYRIDGHLLTLVRVGSHAELFMEVHAEVPEGIPEERQRIVNENCRTLKFQSFGFEEE